MKNKKTTNSYKSFASAFMTSSLLLLFLLVFITLTHVNYNKTRRVY